MFSSDPYKVKKSDLLERIKANRQKHIADFEAANVEYRKRAEQALRAKLARVQEGRSFRLRYWPNLIPPQSHQREYDQVIGLLQMTTDDIINITASDYARFVEDDWEWKTEFSTALSNYSKSADDPNENDSEGEDYA